MSLRSKWVNGLLSFFNTAHPRENIPIAPVVLYDDFLGPITIDATDGAVINTGAQAYNLSIINGGTATDVADADATGCMRITMGNADDDDMDLATGLVFYAESAPSIEVRCANNDVDKLAHFIGFSDAITENADNIAFMSGAVLSANVDSQATDGAGWLWDPDLTTDYLCCVSANAGTDGTNYTTTTDVDDGEWATYRVDIDTAGNAYFYLNGSLVYTEALAVATTAALCGIVSLINHPGASDTFDIDYIRIWANRTV